MPLLHHLGALADCWTPPAAAAAVADQGTATPGGPVRVPCPASLQLPSPCVRGRQTPASCPPSCHPCTCRAVQCHKYGWMSHGVLLMQVADEGAEIGRCSRAPVHDLCHVFTETQCMQLCKSDHASMPSWSAPGSLTVQTSTGWRTHRDTDSSLMQACKPVNPFPCPT